MARLTNRLEAGRHARSAVWPAILAVAAASALAALAMASTPQVVQTREALDAVAAAGVAWQNEHACSGCHKQSIPLAAIGLAREQGHDAPSASVIAELFDMMVDGNRGRQPDGCFGTTAPVTNTAFSGHGLSGYHRNLGDVREMLLAAADCLVGLQETDGRLVHDDNAPPVAQGTINTTAHGIAAWEAAFELGGATSHADASDLAETWLRSRVSTMLNWPNSFTTQEKAMLMAGLGFAGAGPTDPDVTALRGLLATEQLGDSSWKLRNSYAGGNAHATGQVVFALRAAGHDRTDPLVDTGTDWLLQNQQVDGLWPPDFWDANTPSDIAPSMWAAYTLATYPSPLNGLRLDSADDETVFWDPVPGAERYDLVRGELAGLAESAGSIDLGSVSCLAGDASGTSARDGESPAPGTAFFYLMRIRWASSADIYGRSTGGKDRVPTTGGCPP